MMEEFLFKSSVSLAVLYVLYFYLLQKGANHQLNRFIGLACVFFSIVIPFASMEGLYTVEHYRSNLYTILPASNAFDKGLNETQNSNPINIYFMIYIGGCVLLMLRFISGLATLVYYYHNEKIYHRWGFRVVTINKDVPPFTFFHILFVGNRFRNNDGLGAMLVHEQVHRNQYHSIDVMVLEMLTVLFWFNPAIWMFQRSIRATHEYQADQEVLKKGFPLLDYQHLLFKARAGVSVQLGSYLSSIINLNKRFKMMNTPNISSNKSYLRLWFFVPAIIVITGLSSFIAFDNQIDTPAVYESGIKVMYKTLGESLKYPKNARENNRSGLVYVSFTVSEEGEVSKVVPKNNKGTFLEKIIVVGYMNSKSNLDSKGVSGELEREAVRVVKGLGKFIPAKKDDVPVSSVLTLPIKFRLQ